MGTQDKLLLEYKGKNLIQHAVDLLASLPCQEKILVTLQPRLSDVTLPQTVLAVINHSPQAGQSKSLHLGLNKATGDHYLFLNADQPLLSLESLQRLFDLANKNADKIIYPTVDGKPRAPVLFPARFRKQLLDLTGDTGGRAVRAAYPRDCMGFEAENPDDFIDVDCMEDYRRLPEPV